MPPMFKMKNNQAMALNSATMNDLLTDKTRCFPTETAFQISDILYQVGTRVKAYQDALKAIAEKHKGVLHPDGRVVFEDPANAPLAKADIDALGEVELEYTGEKLKMTSDWPKLTLAEAMILRPLIHAKTDK